MSLRGVSLDFLCMVHNNMDSREIIKLIQKGGWKLVRINGSHHHFHHLDKPGLVTVPHPRKDLPQGTARSILKQAGLR